MLTVTEKAKETLEESLQEQTEDPEVSMRIVPSPTKPNELELTLDKEREGDQVVESEGGKKVPLIPSNLATKLKGMASVFTLE